MVLISSQLLQHFVRDLFVKAGMNDEEASAVSHSLVLSDLYGHASHGVMRCRQYCSYLRDGTFQSGHQLKIINETDAVVVADGQQVPGQVQMPRILERLEDKARALGVASGTLYNTGHIGRLGEWVQWATERKLAAMVFVNDNGTFQAVAPPGGMDAITSTNPLAFGIPTEEHPYIFDMSTSAVAMGKVRVKYMAEEECPDGWVQDHEGHPSRDPSVLFEEPKGTIYPYGGADGHKGFGLALVMDMLVSGLSGGFVPPAPKGTPECNNVLITMWDPAVFHGYTRMATMAQGLLDNVRHSRKSPDCTQSGAMRVAGDRSYACYVEQSDKGVQLDPSVWAALERLAGYLDVSVPQDVSHT